MNDLVSDLVRRVAGQVLGAQFELQRLSPDAAFEDLGIDSLYLTEITYGVLKELDLYVPMAVVAETRTIGNFVSLIEREARAAGIPIGEPP